MKKLLAVMFACTLLLTGCGSDEEPNISENTGKEQLIVAMDTESAPYNYLSETQNDNTIAFGKSYFASGYDVLVARDLAKSLKKELVIKKMSSAKFEEALDSGEVDIVINGLLKEDENDNVTYSSAYGESGLSIVVSKDDKSAAFTDIKQFKKLKVSAQTGMASDRVIDQIKDVKHQEPKANTAELLKALKDKKTDAIVLDNATAALVAKQNSDVSIVSLKKGFKVSKSLVMAMEEDSKDSELYKGVESFLKKLKKETKEEYMNIANNAAPAFLK
ncbi:MAG: transporter substrate-binding domain-containing protein [Longicatena sp.]